MVLTLANGGTYFFQAGTEELVQEWTSSCNYWAARTSKEPLAGGVSNMEYGWNRVEDDPVVRARSTSEDANTKEADDVSVRSGRSGRSKYSKAQTVRSSPWSDRILINDWKPPMTPAVPSAHDEETQLDSLRKHVKAMNRELAQHNEMKAPMVALVRYRLLIRVPSTDRSNSTAPAPRTRPRRTLTGRGSPSTC
jgi:PH/SEC7 domain-containing protein